MVIGRLVFHAREGVRPRKMTVLNSILIQCFESNKTNELVRVTRSCNLLTVAGSISNNVMARVINGQGAGGIRAGY